MKMHFLDTNPEDITNLKSNYTEFFASIEN